MRLDIRLPIGLMFALVGAILAVYGLVSDPAIYKRSLDINVNLWWGLVMAVFGGVMLLLAWRARASAPSSPAAPAGPEGGPPAVGPSP